MMAHPLRGELFKNRGAEECLASRPQGSSMAGQETEPDSLPQRWIR